MTDQTIKSQIEKYNDCCYFQSLEKRRITLKQRRTECCLFAFSITRLLLGCRHTHIRKEEEACCSYSRFPSPSFLSRFLFFLRFFTRFFLQIFFATLRSYDYVGVSGGLQCNRRQRQRRDTVPHLFLNVLVVALVGDPFPISLNCSHYIG